MVPFNPRRKIVRHIPGPSTAGGPGDRYEDEHGNIWVVVDHHDRSGTAVGMRGRIEDGEIVIV